MLKIEWDEASPRGPSSAWPHLPGKLEPVYQLTVLWAITLIVLAATFAGISFWEAATGK